MLPNAIIMSTAEYKIAWLCFSLFNTCYYTVGMDNVDIMASLDTCRVLELKYYLRHCSLPVDTYIMHVKKYRFRVLKNLNNGKAQLLAKPLMCKS